jgi:FkbM family methyltransferase
MANNPRHLRPQLTSIYSFLDFYAQSMKDDSRNVFCLQVGANDGRTNDPVHKYFRDYGWKGLLVEPQTDVFNNELTKTYANNSNVILENVALGKEEGQLSFYRVAISKARWATGLSGFCKKSLEGHIENGYIQRKAKDEGVVVPDDLSKLIEEVKVPSVTTDTLLRKHQIESFDLLCIDTEGYDFEVIKLIDFKKYHPEVILFESKNLSDKDFIEAKTLLTSHGYTLYWEKGDTLAIKYAYPLYVKILHKMKAFIRKI